MASTAPSFNKERNIEGHRLNVRVSGGTGLGRRVGGGREGRRCSIATVTRLTHRFFFSHSQVYGCAISPDGALVATGNGDKSVRVLDATTGDVIHSFQHSSFVRGVASYSSHR